MVPTHRSETAFARGALMGVLMMLIPSDGEDGAEGRGELGVAISNVERGWGCPFRQVVAEVAGLLSDPATDGVGRNSGNADEPDAVLDEEQYVEPSEQDGVDREEVTGDQALRLSVRELGPDGTRASRRGVDAPTLQDRPDARWGDGDAHGGELAMDPSVAPGRVLTSQSNDEDGYGCGDRGSTGPTVWVGPASADEVAVPAQQRGRLDEEASATGSWEKA